MGCWSLLLGGGGVVGTVDGGVALLRLYNVNSQSMRNCARDLVLTPCVAAYPQPTNQSNCDRWQVANILLPFARPITSWLARTFPDKKLLEGRTVSARAGGGVHSDSKAVWRTCLLAGSRSCCLTVHSSRRKLSTCALHVPHMCISVCLSLIHAHSFRRA